MSPYRDNALRDVQRIDAPRTRWQRLHHWWRGEHVGVLFAQVGDFVAASQWERDTFGAGRAIGVYACPTCGLRLYAATAALDRQVAERIARRASAEADATRAAFETGQVATSAYTAHWVRDLRVPGAGARRSG